MKSILKTIVRVVAKEIRPKVNGVKGENAVARLLSRFDGITLNNYMLLDGNGKSHQIDHIYVGKEGLFIVETKNYGGQIYGSAEQAKWIQVMAGGHEKNFFIIQ